MARVHVAQHPVLTHDGDEQREVRLRRRAGVEVLVEAGREGGEIPGHGHAAPQGGLHVGHEKGGGDALARDVPHQERNLSRGQHEVVEEIPAHLAGREGDALDAGRAT